MKLIEIKKPVQVSGLKRLTIEILNYNLNKLKVDNSLGLNQILEKYSMSEILNTFNSVTINSAGVIYIPSNTKSDKILRYLEFGGEGVRATRLLTRVSKDLEKILGGED